MQIGFVGLGKMGFNMVQRLLADGHQVVVFDRNAATVAAAAARGARAAATPQALSAALAAPRTIWMMVPSGVPVTETINALEGTLAPGDVLVDGGNSNFGDSQLRARQLKERGVDYLDVGTSGGVWGLQQGYCLMVGGARAAFERIEPVFRSLAPPDGYAWLGESGAGHFVKMVHNGIEYGVMQAYAEGFEILEKSGFGLDLPKIADVWEQGSVIRSWLLHLAGRALKEDPHLESIQGVVEDSGLGRATVRQAIEQDVPAPVITMALLARLYSRNPDSFSARLLAALRNQFGGHEIRKIHPKS